MDVRTQPKNQTGGRLSRTGFFVGVLALWSGFATGQPAAQAALLPQTQKGNMHLSSTAFKAGEPIPAKFTCDGSDIAPPLAWTNVPPNTKSFALIADDPDAPAGTWVHWVLYNLPASATELPEDTPKSASLTSGAKQGVNDFKRLGYGGPCPPPGKAHRYFFKLYALDTALDLGPAATKKELERAMEKHILGQTQWMGTYQRR